MMTARKQEVLVELDKSEYMGYELEFRYRTKKYYDILRHDGLFSIAIELKEFDEVMEKTFTGKLYEDYLENPTAYKLTDGDVPLGYLEIDRETWSNRLRITELLIDEKFRGIGYGSKLIDKAKEIAKKENFREIILETQSCNYLATQTYIKNGFVVNGIDLSCYSNADVEDKEVRLELVYKF